MNRNDEKGAEKELAGNFSEGFRGFRHSGTDAPFFQSAAVTAVTRPDQATTDGVKILQSTTSVHSLHYNPKMSHRRNLIKT